MRNLDNDSQIKFWIDRSEFIWRFGDLVESKLFAGVFGLDFFLNLAIG